ncbi:MAG: hypothetical protein WA581_02000 [Candidatus Acidiferrales bacterium]
MTTEEETIVLQIRGTADGSGRVPASLVKGWMKCPSMEVQGVVTRFIIKHSRRIEPPLAIEEVCGAVQDYYKRCLIEDVRDSGYVPNRHVAGHELVNWFKYLWTDSSVPREHVLNLKAMLRELYLGNAHLRSAIINSVLEHLFETPEIREFFADWKSDADLAEGFALAREWGDHHAAG